MATANPAPGAFALEDHNGPDPFVANSHDAHRQRYTAFDNAQFSLYLNSSPAQAKRALQAHLSETTRRLQEASHLGNALVQQRKELEEKLHEVEQQETNTEIGPELRQRLAELEKEFNEVGRETARAFLPKSRAPSGEAPDTTPGASIFSSEAQPSPSKISVPSRKQRNQQPSRINDIALATEISTSLLSQLKDLQGVLREKDEALKAANLDRGQLEIEVEGLSQRLRTLDESESRLKDVNWNLETQVREFESQSKSSTDKEHRLAHNLNLVKTEKSALERELEELRQQYAKLSDEHSSSTKHHESELSGLRRNVSMGETERGALQRKVEELAIQNQELAKAVAYRLRGDEHSPEDDSSPDDNGDEGHTITPEHSPPVSPAKPTPRHGQLESETLKHSLNHAHRMIQQLKNNIHREKTEKIELKRMLQDARDELETNRNALNPPDSARRRRKNDKEVFKKPPRPDRLGAFRMGSQEIVMDEDEWEEQEDVPPTPSRRPRKSDVVPGSFPGGFSSAAETSGNEGFETANETSDAAFETANERDGTTTETDAFQTGAETLDGDSSDDLTETEAGRSTSTIRKRPSSLSASTERHRREASSERYRREVSSERYRREDSYESTASTSGDEYDEMDVRTPVHGQHPRYRLKVRQGAYRRTSPRLDQELFSATPPAVRDSPASAANSNRSTPIQGKSLFAELGELNGDSEDGSIIEGTPSRSDMLSPESSPEAVRRSSIGRSPLRASAIPKPLMVDSSMMTEPWAPEEPAVSHVGVGTEPETPKRLAMSSISIQDTQPVSPVVIKAPPPSLHLSTLSTQRTEPRAPAPPSLHFSSLSTQGTLPQAAPKPTLNISSMSTQGTVPQSPPPPSLHISALSAQGTVPQSPPAPALNISSLTAQGTSPRSPPPPALNISTLSSQGTVPQSPPAPELRLSTLSEQDTAPQAPASPSLNLSTVSARDTEPVAPVVEKAIPPTLNISSIAHQTTEPAEPSVPQGAPVQLLASGISAQTTEPVEPSRSVSDIQEPRHITVPLNVSSVSSQATEPKEPSKQSFNFSSLSAQATEPAEPPKPALSQLSAVSSQSTAPVELPKPIPSQISVVSSQTTEPVEPPRPAPPQLSTLATQFTEPVVIARPVLSHVSTVSSQATEPVEAPRPALSKLASLSSQSTEPVEPLKPAAPQFSTVWSQSTEPVEPFKPAAPQFSAVWSQSTEPVEPPRRAAPQVSALTVQHTAPVEPLITPQPENQFSDVMILQDTQPESPTLPPFLPSPSRPSTAHRISLKPLVLSDITSQETQPAVSSRPSTAQKNGPSLLTSTASAQTDNVKPPSRDRKLALSPISTNGVASERGRSLPAEPKSPTADGATQTMVSAEQIDKLLLARSQRHSTTLAHADIEKRMSPPASPSRSPNRSPRRPGSSGSARSRGATPPPLPADHREVIAAAALRIPPTPGNPPSSPGSMGPPVLPASATKKRPQTPSIRTSHVVPSPKTGGTTPRPRNSRHGDRSGASSPMTRRSSVSSFASEVDQRFNTIATPNFNQSGLDPNATDSRMIQAITQTMIGEFLWKYTRKAGREDMSENRHRRFFWIHPYTRTLYWSEHDPVSAGKAQLKAKSVAIEAVEEVNDDNPMPPGLHRKSLIVITPGRTIKFTAPTSQRHETWWNALTYLLLRTSENQEEQKATTDEVQSEFNPAFRSSSRQTGRSRASLASYVSRRTSSPHHSQVPTLRPKMAQRAASRSPRHESSSRLSSVMLRPTSALRGSFSSRRSKTSTPEVTYEEPNNSAMELSREMVEANERDVDMAGMVNVRACCDGKHDVGHLHQHTIKARHSSNNVDKRPSFIGSMSSRSHSRAESRSESRTEQIRENEGGSSAAGG